MGVLTHGCVKVSRWIDLSHSIRFSQFQDTVQPRILLPLQDDNLTLWFFPGISHWLYCCLFSFIGLTSHLGVRIPLKQCQIFSERIKDRIFFILTTSNTFHFVAVTQCYPGVEEPMLTCVILASVEYELRWQHGLVLESPPSHHWSQHHQRHYTPLSDSPASLTLCRQINTFTICL